MKKYISTTFVKRCYFCPRLFMSTERKGKEVTRIWTCMELEREIARGTLIKTDKKYKEQPIIHQDNWFPEWCPLEDVNND
jgi:hypothetical protein